MTGDGIDTSGDLEYPLLSADPSTSPILPGATQKHVNSSLVPVRLAYFVLGVGTLLPWNSFLSTIDFFALAFPSLPIGVVISVATLLPLSLVSLLLVTGDRRHYAFDILSGFVAFTLVAGVVPFLAPSSPVSYFSDGAGVILQVLPFVIAVSGVAVASAFAQTALYASASLLSAAGCLEQMNAGTGLAGVLVAMVRMATLYYLSQPESSEPQALLDAVRPSVYIFFVSCSCICVVCVTVVLWLTRTPLWIQAIVKDDATGGDRCEGDNTRNSARSSNTTALRDAYDTACEVRAPFSAIFLTFSITITLFPALFTDIRKHSVSPDSLPAAWLVVSEVLLFNIGDFLGKSVPICSMHSSLSSPNGVLHWAVLRLAFCPVVLLASAGWWSPSDTELFVLIFLFGSSNGVLSNAALGVGAAMVPLSKRAAAGKSLFLGLIGGMASGSLIGAALKAVMK